MSMRGRRSGSITLASKYARDAGTLGTIATAEQRSRLSQMDSDRGAPIFVACRAGVASGLPAVSSRAHISTPMLTER
jgi:hypothetical protein